MMRGMTSSSSPHWLPPTTGPSPPVTGACDANANANVPGHHVVPAPMIGESAEPVVLTALEKQWLGGGQQQQQIQQQPQHQRIVSAGSSACAAEAGELQIGPVEGGGRERHLEGGGAVEVVAGPMQPMQPPAPRRVPVLPAVPQAPPPSSSAAVAVRIAASPLPPPPIARQDSFAACSVVSSLSGDDGQSVGALGGLGVDVVEAAERERVAKAKASARLPFRDSSARASQTAGLGCSDEASLSLSASSSSEGTLQTGRTARSSLPSAADQQPHYAESAAAPQTPFLNTLLDRKQQQNQLFGVRQHKQSKNRPNLAFSTKRNVSGGSASSGTLLKRQLSAHAPLRDRLAGMGLVSDTVPPPPPVLRRPSLVSRCRSAPAIPVPAMTEQQHQQRISNLCRTPSAMSSNASVGSASFRSGGAHSCSALHLSRGTPPRPLSSSFHLPRTHSAASLASNSTYSQNQSVASASASDAVLVLGDGRVIEGVRRRNAHTDAASPFAASISTPSPELLAGRPMRQLPLQRVQSMDSQSSAAAFGTEDPNVRRALNEYNTSNDARCCQSYREAELRKRTNVVKEEIKYKLGRIVPKGLNRRSRSVGFGGLGGGGSGSGGDGGANDPKKVHLQRASGCLT